jgi:hypothetical protein
MKTKKSIALLLAILMSVSIFVAPVSAGYCVDTVGMDAEMIRKYGKYHENMRLVDKKYHFT